MLSQEFHGEGSVDEKLQNVEEEHRLTEAIASFQEDLIEELRTTWYLFLQDH